VPGGTAMTEPDAGRQVSGVTRETESKLFKKSDCSEVKHTAESTARFKLQEHIPNSELLGTRNFGLKLGFF